MPYQIKCDDLVLYDVRDEDLTLKNPKCKLAVNTVGEASFTILANHPCYNDLKKMISVFEINQNGETIFRGRMTDYSKDFHNKKLVDLEGVMAFFNDSMIRPFVFPDDFLHLTEYKAEAEEGGNVVRFLLRWFIDTHNSQVEPFQRFKLGRVTVSDPNNTIVRSSEDYQKTWDAVKSALFESSLGGYLCIRYEADGNYIDYLADFTDENGERLRNSQKIAYGENLLDIQKDSDATETYSAIIPLGKGEDDTVLTIKWLEDGKITDDIVKVGDTLYSISAVAKYGWIYAPVSETTWEDVTVLENLQVRGLNFLEQNAIKIRETVTITAVDLNLADKEIETFRIYRYIGVESKPHDHTGEYPLSELDIDIENPKNTKITVGESKKVLTDKTNDIAHKLDNIEKHYAKNEVLRNEIINTRTLIEQTDENIKFFVAQDYISQLAFDTYKRTTSAEMALKIGRNDKNEVVGIINFVANQVTIQSDYFTLSANGEVELRKGGVGNLRLSNGELTASDGVCTTTVGANKVRTARKDNYVDRSTVLRDGRFEVYLNSSTDNHPVFGVLYFKGAEYFLMFDKDNGDENGYYPLVAFKPSPTGDVWIPEYSVAYAPDVGRLYMERDDNGGEVLGYKIYYCVSATGTIPDSPEAVYFKDFTGDPSVTHWSEDVSTDEEGWIFWGVSVLYYDAAANQQESRILWDKTNYLYNELSMCDVRIYNGMTGAADHIAVNCYFTVADNEAPDSITLNSHERANLSIQNYAKVQITGNRKIHIVVDSGIEDLEIEYSPDQRVATFRQTKDITYVSIFAEENYYSEVEFVNTSTNAVILQYEATDGRIVTETLSEGEDYKAYIVNDSNVYLYSNNTEIYVSCDATVSYSNSCRSASYTQAPNVTTVTIEGAI